MKSAIKTIGLGAAILLASTSLSSAFEEGKLLVGINGDKGFNGLQACSHRSRCCSGCGIR